MNERPNNKLPWWHPDRPGDSLKTLNLPQFISIGIAVLGIGAAAVTFLQNSSAPNEKHLKDIRAPKGSELRGNAQHTLETLEGIFKDVDDRSLKALDRLNSVRTTLGITDIDLEKIQTRVSKDQGRSFRENNTDELTPELQNLIKQLRAFEAEIKKIKEEGVSARADAEKVLNVYLTLVPPGAPAITPEEKRRRLGAFAAELDAQSKGTVSASPSVSELIQDAYKQQSFLGVPMP